MNESRSWLLLAGGAALCWLLYLLAPVLTPFAIAAGLAYLGDPLVDRLEAARVAGRAIGRTLAVCLVFAVMLLAFAVLLLIFIPLLVEQARHLFERAPLLVEWLLDTALPWLQSELGISLASLEPERLKETVAAYWKETANALLGVMGGISAGGQALLGWLATLLLVPVVTFYLMRDWDRLLEGVRTLLPPALEPVVSRLAGEIDGVLGAFMRGQFLVMLALAGVYTLGLWLIGLDLALIIGVSAGLLSIVPYLGTLVGMVAAVLAALLQFQDVLHPVLALAVFAAGQSLEGMVLAPKLIGDRVGLHPVAVIFAVLAGGQLFGMLGILLALPVASALNVLVRHAHQRYRGSALFGEPPAGGEGS